jgi:predicted secreted protein
VRKLFFILIIAALLLMGCSKTSETQIPIQLTFTPAPPRPTPNAAELKLTDPATPIDVSAGKEFTITVKTFLTPDYHWELAEALDPHIVAYVWKDHVPDDPNNANSSGKDVWRFLAVGPGKTTIALGYYQGMTVNAQQKPVFTVVVK